MSKSSLSVCFYCADQNTHRDRSRGITTYTQGLLAHLRDTGQLKISALTSKSSFPVPEGLENVTLPFRSDHFFGRVAADHLHPLMVKSLRPDIWHYPKGFLPRGPQVRGRRIGTIADVMLQYDADHHPNSRSRWAWVYWIGVLKHSIQKLDLIITISEFSKRAIAEFCERHGLRCPQIVVVYPGVSVFKSSEPSAKENHVVHLASRLPYKGTRWLLEQWHSLDQQGMTLPELRLIGDLDGPASELLPRLRQVSLTPPLPRDELEAVISNARALLMPSEIEGFGIPAVEAYLLGTPVAYSRKTALEEIVGPGSPGGFERNCESLAAALQQVLDLERTAIAEKSEEFKAKYSWANCVRGTLNAYRSVL